MLDARDELSRLHAQPGAFVSSSGVPRQDVVAHGEDEEDDGRAAINVAAQRLASSDQRAAHAAAAEAGLYRKHACARCSVRNGAQESRSTHASAPR